MNTYTLTHRIHTLMNRDKHTAHEIPVPLMGGKTAYLVEVCIRTTFHGHDFQVYCGTPNSRREFETAFLKELNRIASRSDKIALAEDYFRRNLDWCDLNEAIEWGEEIHSAIVSLSATLGNGEKKPVK